MESNASGNFQDYVDVKTSGETSIVTNEFTYTWVVRQFVLFHDNIDFTDDIVSPIITVYNRDDKCEFQITISPETDFKNSSFYISTLLCPIDKTEARIKLCIINNNGAEFLPNDYTSKLTKGTRRLAMWCDRWTENCFLDGNLTIRFKITFMNRIHNSELDSAVLEAATVFSKTSILDEYEELLNSAEFSDVTLVVGGKKFPAHKAILASRSPVFSAMFRHDMLEKKKNIVEITDVEPKIMAEVLRFIYAGKVKDMQIFGADLLAVADKYQLEALRFMCEGALVKNMNTDNVADILKIVDRYESFCRLRDSVLKFLTVKRKEVAALKDFDKIFEVLSPALVLEVTKAIMKS